MSTNPSLQAYTSFPFATHPFLLSSLHHRPKRIKKRIYAPPRGLSSTTLIGMSGPVGIATG
jgi:hypothetical protein